MPDGATASKDDLLAAKTDVQDFMAAVDEYLRCVEADVEPAEANAQLDMLEERIRVLERIVTENKYDLKREINSL